MIIYKMFNKMFEMYEILFYKFGNSIFNIAY